MPPNRASIAATAPLDELLAVVLRQFRRPLGAYHASLTDHEAEELARAIVARHRNPLDDRAQTVRDGLIKVVTESEAVLARWNLTFEQSLATTMEDIPGWETTAEFLDIANEKSNAELRIGGAAALVAALGDLRYAPYLLTLASRDQDDDVETWIARRVLSFVSGIPTDAPDWLAQVRAWLRQANAPDTIGTPSDASE